MNRDLGGGQCLKGGMCRRGRYAVGRLRLLHRYRDRVCDTCRIWGRHLRRRRIAGGDGRGNRLGRLDRLGGLHRGGRYRLETNVLLGGYGWLCGGGGSKRLWLGRNCRNRFLRRWKI